MSDVHSQRPPPLTDDEVGTTPPYWTPPNCPWVGQISLSPTPLLREPLKAEHVKPRLLGHWGTTPGLNFIYAHLNRVINQHDLNVIYVAGPGHGGPRPLAHTYLQGTHPQIYPNIAQDEPRTVPPV